MANTLITRMVKVHDPENGNGYVLHFTGDDEGEIKYTAGVRAYFDCPSKRVFLCKKYQRGQCRMNAECISIHADRKVVAELRERSPTKKWAQVVFTVLAEGKDFSVPYEQTYQTAGRDVLMAAKETPGVLCEAHDASVCPDAERCGNIHVTRSHMRHVRNMWRLPCCRECAQHEPRVKPMGPVPSMGVSVGGVHYPADTLASTKGLREMAGDDSYVVMLPVTRVCRPHLRQQCKWGDQCSNVHICRRRYNPSAPTTPPDSSSGSQATVDDDEPPALLDDEDEVIDADVEAPRRPEYPLTLRVVSPPCYSVVIPFTPSPLTSPASPPFTPSFLPTSVLGFPMVSTYRA